MLTKTRHISALALTCALAGPLVAAEAAPAAKPSAAKLQRQVKQLNKQVAQLKRQFIQFSELGTTGPQGPAGPQGSPGPQGEAGAKGEPGAPGTAPPIPPASIGALELAGNAIVSDRSPLAHAVGDYTSKIGSGAIGRGEIADGQVQAAELGTVEAKEKALAVQGDSVGGGSVECDPGQRLIGGGADWGNGVVAATRLVASGPTTDGNGWRATGFNGASGPVGFHVRALCLD
jgi:hypothetical protein